MQIFSCPHCGEKFSAGGEGRYTCPHCDREFQIGLRVVRKNPWEGRDGMNVVRAYFETLKKIIFSPVNFFRGIRPHEAVMQALIFGVISQSITFIVTWLYQTGFNMMPIIYSWFASFAGWDALNFSTLLQWPVLPYYLIVIIVVSPLLSAVAVIFTTCVYHVCLMILGAAKNGFSASLKAVSYSSGVQVMSIIPIVGSIIAAIWAIILTCIGLKEMHHTTYGRVIIAVMLPILLCCGVILMFSAMLMGVLMESYIGK